MTRRKPSHVKWIDHSDTYQGAWIKEQLEKRGVPLGGFLDYTNGLTRAEHDRLYFAEQARLMGNYWRSLQSREGKTSITLSQSAARKIRSYCDRQGIPAAILLEGYAKSLKLTPDLLFPGLTSNAKVALLEQTEVITRLNEDLSRLIAELAAEADTRPSKADQALALLREIKQHLEKLRELASTSRNKGKRIKNPGPLI